MAQTEGLGPPAVGTLCPLEQTVREAGANLTLVYDTCVPSSSFLANRTLVFRHRASVNSRKVSKTILIDRVFGMFTQF